MSALREHFLDKYFGYRRRYVLAVAELAPHRRSLAVASEIARLGFSLGACALVVLIMGTLFVAAISRGSWGNVVYFGIILVPTFVFGCLAIAGIRQAWLDRSVPVAKGT